MAAIARIPVAGPLSRPAPGPRSRPPRVSRLTCSASASEKAQIAVLGASGYTGAEVMRLMHLHPSCDVVALTGESNAGKDFSEVFPHLGVSTEVKKLVKIADVDWSNVDAAFCCLPHATTQDVIASLPADIKVVDLSADFRLRSVDSYAQWYGGAHKAPELQAEAVYGLTEIYREQVKGARLVANPGCYPTCAQLPLIPLLQKGLIKGEDIIIDAKSGSSGAGRAAKVGSLYPEVTEGLHAYGVASHRHMPEIEQGLSEAAGSDVKVSFTPHLMPMSRGMLCTIYAKTADGVDGAQCRQALADFYKDEYFVSVCAMPSIHLLCASCCLTQVPCLCPFPSMFTASAMVRSAES